MTVQKIINNPNLIDELAEALGYGNVEYGQALMVHKNKGTFLLVDENRIESRKQRGWIECVSTSTLIELIGEGETSDSGTKEAEIIAAWMKEQK